MKPQNWPFAKIEERAPDRRGAHQKTLPGRFIRWCGVWEGRPITFTSEPKLVNTALYFLTSSNARIHFTRDLGANYVHIRIDQPLTAESLRRFNEFAQIHDTRQVIAECRAARPASRTTPRKERNHAERHAAPAPETYRFTL